MSKVKTTLEERLIDHIVRTDFEDLDAEAVHCCKKLIMDRFKKPGMISTGGIGKTPDTEMTSSPAAGYM